MRTRGRRSAADAVVIAADFQRRPDPPASLTETQAEIWREIVGTEHPKVFATRAVQYVLADFCRHREAADRINELINKAFDRTWRRHDARAFARLQVLLKMREQETRAAAGLATKLRITNQARYEHQTAGRMAARTATGPAPWDFEGDEDE